MKGMRNGIVFMPEALGRFRWPKPNFAVELIRILIEKGQ